MKFNRQLERLVTGINTQDGAGVSLVRVLTNDLQRRLDPFLMLDNFHSDKPEDYLAVPVEELERDIFATGFYRQKAKALRGTMRILIEDYDGMNKVFKSYFPSGGPARTTVAVAALPGQSLVEINCTAAVVRK